MSFKKSGGPRNKVLFVQKEQNNCFKYSESRQIELCRDTTVSCVFICSRGNVEEVVKEFKETREKFEEILQNRSKIKKYNKV